MKRNLLFFLLLSPLYSFSQETHVVEVRNFEFIPSEITIKPGDIVHFQWVEGDHTITSTNIPPGVGAWTADLNVINQQFLLELTVEGEHHFNELEAGGQMTGVIIVDGEGQTVSVNLRKEVDNISMKQNTPNPAYFNTSIEVNTAGLPGTVKVFNMIGEERLRVDVSGLEVIDLDISSLPDGLYVYCLEIEGQRYVTRKMMVAFQ
ncbi:MAG: T9SS type A sorting domain-containing protein [Cytophagaceae bacterium]